MSRELTGTKKRTAGGWQAGLPRHRGATARVTHTFTSEAAADAWLAAGRAAINEGGQPPAPDTDQLARSSNNGVGNSFRRWFDGWHEEYYGELWRGGLEREITVAGYGRRIAVFMEQHDLYLEDMTRSAVKALQASLTRASPPTGKVAVPEGLDPDRLVTMAQAIELPGMASRATLKRRIGDGLLVPAERPATGHTYRIADLYSEAVLGADGKLRRGPQAKGSLSQAVANEVMRVFDQVCLFALDHGVAVPQDRASLKMHRTDREDSPKRMPVPLTACADIAGHLHVPHQIALWLMRILGLRIGEAFGILVEDVRDHGAGKPGVVTIKAQGGRRFRTRGRDGTAVESDRVEQTKNEQSRRVLVIPPALMDVIRDVIAVFHTAPDGELRAGARLIPGLQRKDAAGQNSFREALATAATAAGVDCTPEQDSLDRVFGCQPHDMRRTVFSDLDRLAFKDGHIQRLAGHIAGPDVLQRSYLLDDPELRPLHEIAEHIQLEVIRELPSGLRIPTMVRCTTGNQPALQPDGVRIDAELSALGWYVTPSEAESGEPLMSAAEVGEMLRVSVQTARDWMASGLIPSVVWRERARGAERRSRHADVLVLRDQLTSQVTVSSLAEEVGQPYHTVYQFIHAQGIELERFGQRGYVVPAKAADRLRSHFARQAELHERAVPLSVAAETLRTTVAVVEKLLTEGGLVEDDRAHDQRRMVTRDSLEAARPASRLGRRYATATHDPNDLVSWPQARTLAGLSDGQMDALVADGTLTQVQYRRRRHVTATSLIAHVASSSPAQILEALSRTRGQRPASLAL